MSEIVSKSVLAERLGVSLPAVDGWVRRGCPMEKRGGRGRAAEFDLNKVTNWVERYTVGISRNSSAKDYGRQSAVQGAIVVEVLSYIYEESLGTVAEAAVASGASLKSACVIDMIAGSELRRIMEQYLKMCGIPEYHLDKAGSWNGDIDWERAAQERGEDYVNADFDALFTRATEATRLRLPRNGDE